MRGSLDDLVAARKMAREEKTVLLKKGLRRVGDYIGRRYKKGSNDYNDAW